MIKLVTRFVYCSLFIVCLQQVLVLPAIAAQKEERIQLLKQKMEKLQELLAKVKEDELRELPPTEKPWHPILASGDERTGYYQYAYLLTPQMPATVLDSIMQQLNYIAQQDEMKERGVVFVIPALPLADGESMVVSKYNRDLASSLLKKIKLPTAIAGGVVVSPVPLGKKGASTEPLLFIDLTGCDQVLRSRIFGLLQKYRLFTEEGSTSGYVWELLQLVAPQAFTVYMHDNVAWLSLAP